LELYGSQNTQDTTNKSCKVLVLNLGVSQTISYPQNSLRFGLLDIKPVEITENTKLGNIRFKVTKTKLEPTKPVNTFEELVTADNTEIFTSVSIPEKFKIPDLIKAFANMSLKRFENDVELQQEIKNMNRSDRGKPFYNFISFMKHRFEKEKNGRLDIEAQRFLMSNLPLTFYNKFAVFDSVYYDFLRTVQEIVRAHEFAAQYSRSNQMYAKKIVAMQHELDPIINKFDECSYAYSRLKKYIIIWNAESLNELNWPKFLDINKIEATEFEQLSKEFDVKLKEMKNILLEQASNVSCKIVDANEPTAKMIRNILLMPSNSLHGGS